MNNLNISLPANLGHKLAKSQIGQISPALFSVVISTIAQKTEQLILVITKDTQTSNRLTKELPFFLPDYPILHFPDRETLPYDIFSPHQDLISERLATLYQLPTITKGILVVALPTLLHYLLPQKFLQAHSFVLKTGDTVDIYKLREQLHHGGYREVGQVMEHGEFTVRGSLIDLFPMGAKNPYRIDLFAEEVDSIRVFDPESQCSFEKIAQINLLPAREYPLTEESISLFRQNWRTQFSGNPLNATIYQDISAGRPSAGVEYYLPLFYEEVSTLFDFLPSDTLVIKTEPLEEICQEVTRDIHQRYEQKSIDYTRPLLPPSQLFLSCDQLFSLLHNFSSVQFNSHPIAENINKINFPQEIIPELYINRKQGDPYFALKQFIAHSSTQILFSAESTGRRESLLALFKKFAVQPQIYNSWAEFLADQESLGIVVSPLTEGFIIPNQLTVIVESQLFEDYVSTEPRSKKQLGAPENIVQSLLELSIGSPIVHLEHGIGRYLGLQTLQLDTQETEFLVIEYADEDKLYVPVSALHLISRYTGPQSDQVTLSRLGTSQWQKTREKAAERIRDVAAELLELYANRAAKKGLPFAEPSENYAAFCAAFAFTATPDQIKVLEEIRHDLQSPKLMDRLVCGDVGFGKTEVAMRTAFLAVENNKQVVVLVPTTLLASQHYETFKDRFAEWPVKIEMLSRFRTTREQTHILQEAEQGKIDILIGTHKLLQANVRFKNLGLIIIDEEHRFGVRQKERLKALRTEVDILTLTATPIPRTLNMALGGIRDLSIISTPPAKRLAIKTFVQEEGREIIQEAVSREIARGGQVYFLHNKVETIEAAAQELRQQFPHLKIVVAHGQMHERELERVMADFHHQRYQILVCSTIIESGIDVPSANTILIRNANRFGLAQLHQLRGRVGRSHHQAYAYLLIANRSSITADAIKRLEAIEQLEELGAGFLLATHDLEIRGAGELLGEDQSGQMEAIGFALYMEMLERAVADLKSGQAFNPLPAGTEIELRIPALIPENYVGDIHLRLTLYKRIANARDQKQLDNLKIEMIDRFGLMPPPLKNLFRVTEIKLRAHQLGIQKIEANLEQGQLLFSDQPKVEPLVLIQLMQKNPQRYKLTSANRLKFVINFTKPEELLEFIEELLQNL